MSPYYEEVGIKIFNGPLLLCGDGVLVMNETTRILCAISSTEPSTFGEFLDGLKGDLPGSSSDWRQLFQTLEALEEQELVIIERLNGRIDTLMLTELGAERAREVITGQDRCPDCVAATAKRAGRL